jgi:separase
MRQGLVLPADELTEAADLAAAERLRTLLLRTVGAGLRVAVPEDAEGREALLPLALCRVLLAVGAQPTDEELDDLVALARAALAPQETSTGPLTAALRAGLASVYAPAAPTAAVRTQAAMRPHTLLVLDRTLQELPWESLPSLRAVPTTRLPSLAFLGPRRTPAEPDPAADGVYYVLNPSGDLADTQDRFQRTFARCV